MVKPGVQECHGEQRVCARHCNDQASRPKLQQVEPGHQSSCTREVAARLPAYAMPRPRMAPIRVWGSSLLT